MGLEGGAKMKAELKDRARRWKSGSVSAGFFDAKTSAIAQDLEFGAPAKHIPPRPFMRFTVEDFHASWLEQLRDNIGASTSAEVLDEIGQNMRADIQKTMLSPWRFQANAPKTIEKKGFDFPLVHTGEVLLPKLRYKVRLGKRKEAV